MQRPLGDREQVFFARNDLQPHLVHHTFTPAGQSHIYFLTALKIKSRCWCKVDQRGGIAQLVERLVRNEKARGSNPLTSTILISETTQVCATAAGSCKVRSMFSKTAGKYSAQLRAQPANRTLLFFLIGSRLIQSGSIPKRKQNSLTDTFDVRPSRFALKVHHFIIGSFVCEALGADIFPC